MIPVNIRMTGSQHRCIQQHLFFQATGRRRWQLDYAAVGEVPEPTPCLCTI